MAFRIDNSFVQTFAMRMPGCDVRDVRDVSDVSVVIQTMGWTITDVTHQQGRGTQALQQEGGSAACALFLPYLARLAVESIEPKAVEPS